MEVHVFLLQLLLILIAARVCGELFARLDLPTVIGELCAGLLLGPSLLGWVSPSELITLLAEVGVILLLFEVGLDTNVNKLIRVGSRAIIVALCGFVAPFVLGFVVCYFLFQLDTLTSLFVGGTLTATSIGITIRTLADIGRHQSREGQIVLGAAVLDDILGVILLAVLFDFSQSGSVDWWHSAKVLLFVGLFFLFAPLIAKLLSRVIYWLDCHSRAEGVIPATIVSLVLFLSLGAHHFGAPELLGGFAAGLALSRRFFLPLGVAIQNDARFSRKIKWQTKPIVQLFTPIFFVSIGLSVDLKHIDWGSVYFWYFSLSVLLLAIAGKFVGSMFLKEPWQEKVAIGMSMVPRGEVGLVFVGLGKISGVFNDEVYTAMVMVIVYTTLLSPFWLKLFYRYQANYFGLKQEQ